MQRLQRSAVEQLMDGRPDTTLEVALEVFEVFASGSLTDEVYILDDVAGKRIAIAPTTLKDKYRRGGDVGRDRVSEPARAGGAPGDSARAPRRRRKIGENAVPLRGRHRGSHALRADREHREDEIRRRGRGPRSAHAPARHGHDRGRQADGCLARARVARAGGARDSSGD